MKRRYFLTAHDGDDVLAVEIEALSFDHAMEAGRELARQRFGSRPWRLTSVTEAPQHNSTGATCLFLAGVRSAEMLRRRKAA